MSKKKEVCGGLQDQSSSEQEGDAVFEGIVPAYSPNSEAPEDLQEGVHVRAHSPERNAAFAVGVAGSGLGCDCGATLITVEI